jgi:hypothetical protein
MFGFWFSVQREVRWKGRDGGRFKGLRLSALKREREGEEREGGLVNQWADRTIIRREGNVCRLNCTLQVILTFFFNFKFSKFVSF